MVWSDEFDGPSGSSVDPGKWSFETGGHGWGNNELQSYTDQTRNARLEKGKLVITAHREDHSGADGIARNYTSARLHTRGKFSQQYGRFEARIRLPRGQGIWPAFWMLGSDLPQAGWPAAGEIDIVENIGSEPSVIHGTLHGPGYSGDKGVSSSSALPKGKKFSDKFHVFAVEWEPGRIRFFVDRRLYRTVTPADLPPNTAWVFDHPFYLILNVAVGGNWPGSPNSATAFPQTMQVDYVRVYRR
ncbi:MAG: glycoside hydrolase family 16 protein [Terriglobales bacterium]